MSYLKNIFVVENITLSRNNICKQYFQSLNKLCKKRSKDSKILEKKKEKKRSEGTNEKRRKTKIEEALIYTKRGQKCNIE